jgi:hypothetical protein
LACKSRDLAIDPKLATGDGALGFWKALRQIYPSVAKNLDLSGIGLNCFQCFQEPRLNPRVCVDG